MPISIRRRFPLILFILFYSLFFAGTFRDYGMTFDESGVYTRGMVLGHYFTHNDIQMVQKSAPDDGLVIYDHFYPFLLSLLNPSGDLDDYHWLNQLFALLAFIALFELLLSRTQKPWLAVLAPLFLALMPRFFGDIPANPKDMPFAVFYLVALCGIYFFHQKPRMNPYAKVLLLGLLFGFAQSCRLLGLTLYPVYVLFDLHFFYHAQKHAFEEWKKHLLELLSLLILVFMVAGFLMVLTWPYLGANFLNHFMESLTISKDFFWKNSVLFLGKEVPAAQLPWIYLPVWFLLTAPLFILFFLMASFGFIKNKMADPLFILMGVAVTVNAVFYLVLKPVIYDGLRHFLFLLPPLASIASLSAAHWLESKSSGLLFKGVLLLCVFNMTTVAYQMARLHPYEYIYFNEFAGGLKGSEGKFDNDYWGASFKESVEWLEQNETKDQNKIYKIAGSGNSYQIFYYFTPNMKWVDDLKDADYYLSYTRDNKQSLVDQTKLIHVIEREGVPLNYIYKLK